MANRSTGAAVMMAQHVMRLANGADGGSWSLIGMLLTYNGDQEEVVMRLRSSHPYRHLVSDDVSAETDDITISIRATPSRYVDGR